jgi:uncharacterized membrane protein YeaQ/YmgE (transglycosylase-associated protein family)
MNKLNLYLPSENADIASDPLPAHHVPVSASVESVRRLLVLVPADSDYAAMTHRVWKLANATGMHVQFLSLCEDAAQEPSLRRALIATSTLIQDGRVCAEVNVEIGMNWVEAVKRNCQPGDMVVCFAEQRVGLLQRPLSQVLESDLHRPVYILAGLDPQTHSRSNWLSLVTVWLGAIGIIVGSAVLQIRITSLPQDWAQTTLLILSVVGEVWLIWAWNSLFS